MRTIRVTYSTKLDDGQIDYSLEMIVEEENAQEQGEEAMRTMIAFEKGVLVAAIDESES